MDGYRAAAAIGTWLIVGFNAVYFLSKSYVARRGLEVRWLFSSSHKPQLEWLAKYAETPEERSTASRWLLAYRVSFWLFLLVAVPLVWWGGFNLQSR